MTFTVALIIAVSYWGARDVQVPCHPTTVRTSSAQALAAAHDSGEDIPADVEASMWTYAGQCVIYIGPDGAVLRTLDEPRGWSYCQDIVHEVGHIAGLSHAYDGVMRADGSGHTPWACTHVRAFLRRWRRDHRTGLAQPDRAQ